MTHPTAAIIVIGNEILSGRTQDLNVHYISQHLTTLGIVVKEVRIIPDDEQVIIDTVRILSSQYTSVFTTGGIGATHDDITAASIAKAFHRELIVHEEAMAMLVAYYGDLLNEARKRMALIPEGSELIANPVSAAPGFKIGNVFCMAGIPSVMQRMFDGVMPQLQSGAKIYSKSIRCSILENNLADALGEIQKHFMDVEIGSYPRYQVTGDYTLSIVLRSTNAEQVQNATQKVVELIRLHGEEAAVV